MKLHPHAIARIAERGTSAEEVAATIRDGERFSAKFGRNFAVESLWRERRYHMKQIEMKQIEMFATWEDDDWLVISVIVRYF